MIKVKMFFFFIVNNELLKKHNKVWIKVSNSISDSDSDLVYIEKHLRTKLKSYEGKTNAIFHNDKMTKEGYHCICCQ